MLYDNSRPYNVQRFILHAYCAVCHELVSVLKNSISNNFNKQLKYI